MRILIALSLALAARSAFGQSGTITIDCATASSILRNGSLAATDSQTYAYATVPVCDTTGANAFAAAMRRRKTASPSNDLFRAFRPEFADTAIANAALDIATDAGASSTARALSLGLLAAYTGRASTPSTSMLSTLAVGDICPGAADAFAYDRSNLPTSEIETVKSRVSTLERDTGTPLLVRAAANCVMNGWRSAHSFPQQPILTFSTLPLQLAYVCGTKFQLQNTGSFVITARAGPSGTTPVPVYWVPAKPSGQPYGTVNFDPKVRGATVQVWFDDQLVASQRATGTGCA